MFSFQMTSTLNFTARLAPVSVAVAVARKLCVALWHVGLPYVEITTDPDNIASQRVIEANGGVLVEHFIKPQQFSCKPGLRFRIIFK